MRIKSKMVFDWLLNSVTVGCVCFLAWSYGGRLFPLNRQPTSLRLGTKLANGEMKFARASGKTLVMVLSTTCHYCQLSAPFYRQLVSAVPFSDTHIVAMFPEPSETARLYLRSAGLGAITDVRQVELESLGLNFTPTLILLDHAGLIESVWTGLLPEKAQGEVLHSVGSKLEIDNETSEAGEPAHRAAALLLAKELRSKSGVAVIDVRERSNFAQSHISMAYNIPIDEIEVRAEHEISRATPVRIYCEFSLSCNDLQRKGVPTMCDVVKAILEAKGYKDVGIIYADVAELSSAGIPVIKQR